MFSLCSMHIVSGAETTTLNHTELWWYTGYKYSNQNLHCNRNLYIIGNNGIGSILRYALMLHKNIQSTVCPALHVPHQSLRVPHRIKPSAANRPNSIMCNFQINTCVVYDSIICLCLAAKYCCIIYIIFQA